MLSLTANATPYRGSAALAFVSRRCSLSARAIRSRSSRRASHTGPCAEVRADSLARCIAAHTSKLDRTGVGVITGTRLQSGIPVGTLAMAVPAGSNSPSGWTTHCFLMRAHAAVARVRSPATESSARRRRRRALRRSISVRQTRRRRAAPGPSLAADTRGAQDRSQGRPPGNDVECPDKCLITKQRCFGPDDVAYAALQHEKLFVRGLKCLAISRMLNMFYETCRLGRRRRGSAGPLAPAPGRR